MALPCWHLRCQAEQFKVANSEWPAFGLLCSARGLGGNAAQDAWIAMAARHHSAQLVTFDRDFALLLDRHEYTLLKPRH